MTKMRFWDSFFLCDVCLFRTPPFCLPYASIDDNCSTQKVGCKLKVYCICLTPTKCCFSQCTENDTKQYRSKKTMINTKMLQTKF